MHNHTLGWTSDNGCNVFALGWLALMTISIVPGGGITGARQKNTDDEDISDILFMFLSLMDMEDQ